MDVRSDDYTIVYGVRAGEVSVGCVRLRGIELNTVLPTTDTMMVTESWAAPSKARTKDEYDPYRRFSPLSPQGRLWAGSAGDAR